MLTLFLVYTFCSEYRCILLTKFTYSETEVLAKSQQAKVSNDALPKHP
jgi:hypothetical protein